MRNKIYKILKRIYVIQEVSNVGRKVALGRGFKTAMRFNPYNPLSYVVIPIMFVVFLIGFGVMGIFTHAMTNPFKWN